MAMIVGEDNTGTRRVILVDNEGKLIVNVDNLSDIFYVDGNGNISANPLQAHHKPVKAETLQLTIDTNGGKGTYNLYSPGAPSRVAIFTDDYVKVTYKDSNNNTLAGPAVIMPDQKLVVDVVDVASIEFDCSLSGAATVSVHEFQTNMVRI